MFFSFNSLEKKCRCLGKQSRMRVYEHLAPFVRCRKESLIRRAKNLLLDSERNRIQTLSREYVGFKKKIVRNDYRILFFLQIEKCCRKSNASCAGKLWDWMSEGDNEKVSFVIYGFRDFYNVFLFYYLLADIRGSCMGGKLPISPI